MSWRTTKDFYSPFSYHNSSITSLIHPLPYQPSPHALPTPKSSPSLHLLTSKHEQLICCCHIRTRIEKGRRSWCPFSYKHAKSQRYGFFGSFPWCIHSSHGFPIIFSSLLTHGSPTYCTSSKSCCYGFMKGYNICVIWIWVIHVIRIW